MSAPGWARLLYRLSRTLNSLNVAQLLVRDELLLAFLRESQRNSLTFEAYSRSRGYTQGGETFLEGLFPWEVELLEDPRVPRSGKVLLGAAGGGRELAALLARGYDVYAFEPVNQLFESASRVARGRSAIVVQASYEDLVARARGRFGSLNGYCGGADLCVLGWGSLSHVTEPTAVLELFRALRALSPLAPVIISFYLRSEIQTPNRGGARKLRGGLRRALEIVSRRPVAAGVKFQTACGFYYEFSRAELVDLSAQAGYEVAELVETPHPHALLLPKAVAHPEASR